MDMGTLPLINRYLDGSTPPERRSITANHSTFPGIRIGKRKSTHLSALDILQSGQGANPGLNTPASKERKRSYLLWLIQLIPNLKLLNPKTSQAADLPPYPRPRKCWHQVELPSEPKWFTRSAPPVSDTFADADRAKRRLAQLVAGVVAMEGLADAKPSILPPEGGR